MIEVEFSKMLIVLPTYNEALNIERIILGIRDKFPEIHILVVDDSSPDGTGFIVKELMRTDGILFLLSKPKKEGLGNAYKTAFQWALANEYSFVVEMDADGSHQNDDLVKLINNCKDSDLVLGSRWIKDGNTIGWSAKRKILSFFGNFYARIVLGTNVFDSTSGFRVFSRRALEVLINGAVKSNGYAFQIETLFLVFHSGLTIKEVPITFLERSIGVSKMNYGIILEAMKLVSVLGLKIRFTKEFKS
jgi:dolichol-phosphate mannosyltransferase